MLQHDEESLVQNLRDSIYMKREKLKNKPYLSEDGFFYVNKTSPERNTILFDIQDYFRNQAIPGYYSTVSELPFKLVINLSPDDYLSRTLTKANRPHEFLFYKNGLWKRVFDRKTGKYSNIPVTDPNKLPPPSIENPWVFNFLGVYEDKESMIFTFDALFEFLYSVFPITNIPDKLKLEIQQSSTFLFMGFNYNKWYLKVIFFILHKICESTGVLKTAVFNYAETQDAISFFQSQFNINFHKENTVAFIEQLHKDCKPHVLPWEPLTDGWNRNGFDDGITICKVLYMASTPLNIMPLRFDKEYKAIQNCLQKKHMRQNFDLTMRSITHKEMLPVIDEYIPNVILFSMHGTKDNGLIFENTLGEQENLSVEEFIKDINTLLKSPRNKIHCIIFSSCHSLEFAAKLSECIPFTIGIEGSIHEEAMFEFCEGFFESFFNSKDYSAAFDMGVRYVEKRAEYRHYNSQIKFFSKKFLNLSNTIQITV